MDLVILVKVAVWVIAPLVGAWWVHTQRRTLRELKDAAGVTEADGLPAGTRVSVPWSDGKRYYGTVARVAGDRVLVTMPDGAEVWFPKNYAWENGDRPADP